MNRQEKKSTRFFKVLMQFWLCFVFWSIGVSAWAIEQYPQSADKDFNTDAPWRVQDELTAIPFVFAIADVYMDPLNELNYCKISLITDISEPDKGNQIYYHDFNKIKIDENTAGSINGNWEWNVKTFENASDPFLSSGLEITPGRLGYHKGSVLFFQTEINGKQGLLTEKLKRF